VAVSARKGFAVDHERIADSRAYGDIQKHPMTATRSQASLRQGGGEHVRGDRDFTVGGQTRAYLTCMPVQGAAGFNLTVRADELWNTDAHTARYEAHFSTLLDNFTSKLSDARQRMTCSFTSFGAGRANAMQ